VAAVLLDPVPCLRGLDPALVPQEDPRGTVYLIHLDRALLFDRGQRVRLARPGEDLRGHLALRHYYGHCRQGRLEQRMIDHRTSGGAKFLRIARSHGATWHLARTWPGDRAEERRHKVMGGASRCCPSCGIIPLAEALRDSAGRYTTRGEPVTITIRRSQVLRGGTVVARLSWGGDGLAVVSVHRASDDAVIGRLLRHDDSLYDAMSAEHPAAATPSDRVLAMRVSAESAIESVLDDAIVRAALPAGRRMPSCGDPDCEQPGHNGLREDEPGG
jgi:hypothetical protein